MTYTRGCTAFITFPHHFDYIQRRRCWCGVKFLTELLLILLFCVYSTATAEIWRSICTVSEPDISCTNPRHYINLAHRTQRAFSSAISGLHHITSGPLAFMVLAYCWVIYRARIMTHLFGLMCGVMMSRFIISKWWLSSLWSWKTVVIFSEFFLLFSSFLSSSDQSSNLYSSCLLLQPFMFK